MLANIYPSRQDALCSVDVWDEEGMDTGAVSMQGSSLPDIFILAFVKLQIRRDGRVLLELLGECHQILSHLF